MVDGEKKSKARKKSWFQGLQKEFKKIIWPDAKTLVMQTIAVAVISFLLGTVITILDSGVLAAINFLIK